MENDKRKFPRKFTWDRCMCSFEYCCELSESIDKHAAEGHPWKGKISFERLTGGKQDVFVYAAKRHLETIMDVDYNGKRYFIARHHFPISLLEANRKKKRFPTTYLSKWEAERIKNSKHECVLREENLVSNIQTLLGQYSPTQKELYVQAPFEPISSVISFVDGLMKTTKKKEIVIQDEEDNDLEMEDDNFFVEFPDWVVNYAFPTKEDLQTIIAYEWSTKKGVLYFDNNDAVRQCITLLRVHHKCFDYIRLPNKSYFGICPMTSSAHLCFDYYISNRQRKRNATSFSSTLCLNCQDDYYNKPPTVPGEIATPSPTKTLASSRATFASLTPEEKNIRLKNLSKKIESVTQYPAPTNVTNNFDIARMMEGTSLELLFEKSKNI